MIVTKYFALTLAKIATVASLAAGCNDFEESQPKGGIWSFSSKYDNCSIAAHIKEYYSSGSFLDVRIKSLRSFSRHPDVVLLQKHADRDTHLLSYIKQSDWTPPQNHCSTKISVETEIDGDRRGVLQEYQVTNGKKGLCVVHDFKARRHLPGNAFKWEKGNFSSCVNADERVKFLKSIIE